LFSIPTDRYIITLGLPEVKNYFIRIENSSTAQFCDIIGAMQTTLPSLRYTRDGLTIATTQRYCERRPFRVEWYRIVVTNPNGEVVGAGAGRIDELTTSDLAYMLETMLEADNEA